MLYRQKDQWTIAPAAKPPEAPPKPGEGGGPLKLEAILTEAGLDYGVEADHYSGGMIFKSPRVGAFFYVLPEAVEATHRIMQANGYRPYELA